MRLVFLMILAILALHPIEAQSPKKQSNPNSKKAIRPITKKWKCGEVWTDVRDGNRYTTVKIGSQCWMAQNLSFGSENSECPGSEITCKSDGRLYSWPVALDACPVDWHLPSDAEWAELISVTGGENQAGGHLKSNNGFWRTPNSGATNSSGFSANGIGFRASGTSTQSIGLEARWWTGTDSGSRQAWTRGASNSSTSTLHLLMDKSSRLTVRCVKN